MTHETFFKVKRVVDKALLRRYAQMPCSIGYVTHMKPVAGHHIKTKGSGGDDVDGNLISLCASHHAEIHSMGIRVFLETYETKMSSKNRLKLEEHIRA